MADKILCFAILVSFVILAAGSRSPDVTAAPLLRDSGNECVYTLYVETGSIWKAGTDAVIGVALAAADGSGFAIRDLERWGGLMGAGHDYYERGNVDAFSGRGPCLSSLPCRMNLTSDGSGPHHGWYCKSVEVTATGPHAGCATAAFGVEQWLARDAPPYQLFAGRSICGESSEVLGISDLVRPVHTFSYNNKPEEYATLDSPAIKLEPAPPVSPPECHCPVGPPQSPLVVPHHSILSSCLIPNHSLPQLRSKQRSLRGHEAPLPSPCLLRCRGVRVGGRGHGGRGRRRRQQLSLGVGPGEQVRVHGVRADGVDLEGRDGLGDRRDAAGLGRHGHPDRQPGAVGRADGERARLLRARQPRHLQRPRALHEAGAVLDEPHLRRHGPAPRLVLQLPRGHRHGPPLGLRAAALHRRAVARHRRLALPPLRRPPLLPQEAARLRAGRRRGRRGRPVRFMLVAWCELWREKLLIPV